MLYILMRCANPVNRCRIPGDVRTNSASLSNTTAGKDERTRHNYWELYILDNLLSSRPTIRRTILFLPVLSLTSLLMKMAYDVRGSIIVYPGDAIYCLINTSSTALCPPCTTLTASLREFSKSLTFSTFLAQAPAASAIFP